MVDKRFFSNRGPITLSALAALTGARLNNDTDSARNFTDVAPLDKASVNDISFLDNIKYLGEFEKSTAGACFVRPKFAARAPKNMALLLTEQPYYCYALAARAFYPEAKGAGISPHAHIASTAKIGKNVSIGAGTVIGEGVEIGDDCTIGALCTISHAMIGQRVTLHRGIHIGQDGFGFAPSPKGIVKVPQLGRVIIGNDVEIGSGTCIDRGAGPDTVIGDGCKIDNLVQIGHNVQLGKYVMIAAQCGLAGSTSVGDGAMLGGQVGVSGHVHIGAGAKLAAQAGVMTDIPDGATYGGSPAVPVKDWHRQTIAMTKLIKKAE